MIKSLLSHALILLLSCHAFAQTHQSILQSVNSFTIALSEKQLKKCSFTLTDEERYNWNFVPASRKGIALKELDSRQQQLFMEILKTALSQQGYEKASSIMQLEKLLKTIENRPDTDDYRDPGKYYFSLFGTPSEKDPWGWRIEGHHLAFNFLYNKNTISALPSFMGSNPAVVPAQLEVSEKQILKQESEKAFALLRSLSAEQQSIAIIADRAFPEIISGNHRSVGNATAQGLSFSQMNALQQKLFRELLTVYVMNYSKGVSEELMKEMEVHGLNQFFFAWAGARQWGQGHYYRIQGPSLWIEYDNVQNNANHVHTVVRSINNDFGEDLLKKHYEEEHHKK